MSKHGSCMAYHPDDRPEAFHNQGGAAFIEPMMESFASALAGEAGRAVGKGLKKMFDPGLGDDEEK